MQYFQRGGTYCKGGGGGPAEHGTLKLFSSSLMSMLVEAGVTHQVVPCFHTVVVSVVRGERGGGSCITWDLKVAFHLFDAHVSRGGILNHGRQIVKELRYRQSINNPLKVVYQLFFKGDRVTQWFGVHTQW